MTLHRLTLFYFAALLAVHRLTETSEALSLGGTRTKIRRILFRRSEEGMSETKNPRLITSATTISSPLVPSKGSAYIPDGLTEEQYQQIKMEESRALASKDYGAWGPRFKRDAQRPDGDWMLQPQLWTRGSVVEPRKQQQGDDGTSNSAQIYTKRGLIFKRVLPMLALMILIVESSTLLSLTLRQSWSTSAAGSSGRMMSRLLRQWLSQTTVMALFSSDAAAAIASRVVWAKGVAICLGTPLLMQICHILERSVAIKPRNILMTIVGMALLSPFLAIAAMAKFS